jgi:hypothetical protein
VAYVGSAHLLLEEVLPNIRANDIKTSPLGINVLHDIARIVGKPGDDLFTENGSAKITPEHVGISELGSRILYHDRISQSDDRALVQALEIAKLGLAQLMLSERDNAPAIV